MIITIGYDVLWFDWIVIGLCVSCIKILLAGNDKDISNFFLIFADKLPCFGQYAKIVVANNVRSGIHSKKFYQFLSMTFKNLFIALAVAYIKQDPRVHVHQIPWYEVCALV